MRIFFILLVIGFISCHNVPNTETSPRQEDMVVVASQKIFDKEMKGFVELVCQLKRDSTVMDVKLVVDSLVLDSRRFLNVYHFSMSEAQPFVKVEYDATPNGSYRRQLLLMSKNGKLVAVYHDDARIRSHGQEFDQHGNVVYEGTWFMDQYFTVDRTYSGSGPALAFSQKTSYKRDSLNRVYDIQTITEHQEFKWDSITGVYCTSVSSGEQLQIAEVPKSEMHIPVISGQNPRIYWKGYWYRILDDSTIERIN